MKIALVHDHITCKAGGEQVLLAFHRAFPDAPIFTLAYDPQESFSEFLECNIKTSWFQYISNKKRSVKLLFFPLGVIAASMIDTRQYDVILMSTTHCAKYVKISKNAIVFCYSHNPFRLAWYPESYGKPSSLKRVLLSFIIPILRFIDKKSINRVNYLLTNSNTVQKRLQNIYNYNKPIYIFPPPVNLQNFYSSDTEKKYFLVVSRFEIYKKVDLVIDVFNDNGLPLVIVGTGSMEYIYKKKAKRNIVFYKNLDPDQLSNIYSNAKCLIFPQLEDFGITPLEANASGIPVIAFGKGGILDTQIPLTTDASKATAIFFRLQTPESLKDAIETFQIHEKQFNSIFIQKHVEQFSESMFIHRIIHFINNIINT